MGFPQFLLRFLLGCCLCAVPASLGAQTLPFGSTAPGADPFLGTCTRTTQWQFERVSAAHLRLTGQVQIECPQMGFFADVIDIFTDPELRLVATGNVVFTNPEGRIAAERVEFNVGSGTGTFYLASGIMSLGDNVDRAQFGGQDPDVYFYGDTIEKLDDRRYKLTRGGFTTCVQPTPRWEITSNSVVIVLDNYAIARNTVLRVKGVPMMYLPILYYPIKEDDRATGILMPTYGSSTLRGQSLSNAFFWAIGRSQDATFAHDWFTRAGHGAGAEYRYMANQSSYGNFRFYRLWQHEAEFEQGGRVTSLPAQSSYQFTGTGNQAIGTSVRLHQRVDYASSIVSQQLYQQDFYQASNATRTIEGGISGTWAGVSASGLFQRTETFSDAVNSQLYGSTPRVTAAVAPRRIMGLPVYASVNSEAAYLPYRRLSGGIVTGDKSLTRVDVFPSVRAALSRLSFLSVNTSASFRTTYYTRSADAQGNVTDEPLVRRYMVVRTDAVGPVLSRIWDTPASGFSERMKHLIEPTFSLEYIPTIDNAASVLTLSDSTDLIPGGTTRFTYGVNNRLLYRGRAVEGTPGQAAQLLMVGVQQTYYATPRSSLNDTQYVSTSFRSQSVDLSDVAVIARVTPSASLDSTTRLEFDVHGERLHVITTGTTARIGGSSTTVNYSLYRRKDRDSDDSDDSDDSSPASPTTFSTESSLSLSTSLDLLERRARGSYAITWDIGRRGILSQTVNFAYLAQCCGLQVEFQKYNFPQSRGNFPVLSDRRFNVSFVLAGVGTFSNFLGAFGGNMGTGN